MTNRIFHIVLTCFLLASCASHNRIAKRKVTVAPETITNTISLNRIDTLGNVVNTELESEIAGTKLDYYLYSLIRLNRMLEGDEPLSFKKAVYFTENAYHDDSLDYEKFDSAIERLVGIGKLWMAANTLTDYEESDYDLMHKNASIYSVMHDTIFLTENTVLHMPFTYNFSDFLAEDNWTNQFVATLLVTGKGNCHSLPYLYKILADELNTNAYLTLAPNHIYVKHRSKKWGWYNSELTSGEFPTDAWVKASGYITLDAIRSGIYMDTLSNKQNIALCVYDLAKGYLKSTGNYLDGFVITCCDIVLKHHPNNINALILKAETLKQNYKRCQELGLVEAAQKIYTEMQRLYVKGVKMGYREMPLEMYQSWLLSVKEQKDKYVNNEIRKTFKN